MTYLSLVDYAMLNIRIYMQSKKCKTSYKSENVHEFLHIFLYRTVLNKDTQHLLDKKKTK